MKEKLRNSRLAITGLASAVLSLLTFLSIIALHRFYPPTAIGPFATLTLLSILLALILASIISGTLALFQIRKYSHRMTGRAPAVCGIIVGLLVFLTFALFAGATVRRARTAVQMSRCKCNIRQIELLKVMWAEENNATNGQTITWQDLGHNIIACPGGGSYTLNPIGTDPECSIPEHKKFWQNHVKYLQSPEHKTEMKRVNEGYGCRDRIRTIAVAKWRWARDNDAPNGQVVTWADIDPYIKRGSSTCICPSGGTYTIGLVGENPECSVSEHNEFWKCYLKDVSWDKIVSTDEIYTEPSGSKE